MGVGVGQKHSQSAKRDYVPLSLLKMKTEHIGGESVMVLVHLSIYLLCAVYSKVIVPSSVSCA